VENADPKAVLKRRFHGRRGMTRGIFASGVWRYRELVVPTMEDDEIISYPEGNTPLITNARLMEFAGIEALMVKHEGMNPTGSFKDRGMTVAMSQAKRAGARAVACASTGNTSASLAAYAALAGLRGLVLIPAGKISMGKLAQTMAHGATTLAVRGDFDDCLALLREASDALGVYVVNSVNPFRLAGQRTIVFEMLQQLEWDTPDWIVLPAGNLGNTSAFGAALEVAHGIGLIARVPRLAAIQASGAAPFAKAFADGFRSHLTVHPETIATAIRIGAPASWDRAIKAIRATNGVVAAVTDEEILEAKKVVDEAGVGCEPASAASVAGVRQLVARGVIGKSERVVAVLTGHVLKDPGIIVERGRPPIEIDATLDAVEEALSRA
jgi:threonine synthase